MDIQAINGCCSMVVISNNPYGIKNREELYKEIRYEMIKKSIMPHRISTVIMITNLDWYTRLKEYWSIGFKKAYTYEGHNGNKAHVLHLNFAKLYEKYG